MGRLSVFDGFEVTQKPELNTETKNYNLSETIKFINVLEGIKTRTKNFHWSANLLEGYNANSIHSRLDDFLGIVSDYQDSVAEESMGILGIIPLNSISGIACDCYDPYDMLKYLNDEVLCFYKMLNEDNFSGIRSETEVFLHELKKYMYLFKICKK